MIRLSCAIWLVASLLPVCVPLLVAQTSSDRHSLDDLFPFLTTAEYRQLLDEGELTNFYGDAEALRYRPNLPLWDDREREILASKPTVGIEALFLYRFPNDAPNAPDDLIIYNILRSIGTMQGIPYWSASRGRERTFIHASYAIADPERREPLPDPLVDEAPPHEQIYIFQRDSSFGENIYRVDYLYQDGAILLTMSNLTTMFYKILPVIAKERVRISLTVLPTHEGILFYGNSGVSVLNLFGLEGRARASFHNRIRALYNWFSNRMEEVNRVGLDR